jgi:hypothetical protein
MQSIFFCYEPLRRLGMDLERVCHRGGIFRAVKTVFIAMMIYVIAVESGSGIIRAWRN